MKVKFSKLAALLLGGAALVAVGCTDYDDDIKDLQKQITALETGKVATVESQVATLQSAVSTLEAARTAIEGDISDLDAQIATINADITLMKQNIDKKLDTETFQNFVATTVKDIQDAVTTLTTRLGFLEGQVGELGTALDNFKAQVAQDYLSKVAFETWKTTELVNKLNEVKAYADEKDTALKAELNEAIGALQTLTETMNAKLSKAISDIEVLDGKVGQLDAKITTEINNLRTEINTKIEGIEKRLAAAEVNIEKLLSRIQSIVFVPDYDDGKMTVNYSEMTQGDVAGQTGIAMLLGQATEATFKVSPADAAAELAAVGADILSFNTKAVKTRADGDAAPELEIIDVKKGAAAGEIVVTFLPKNLNLEAFGYNALKPIGYMPVISFENVDVPAGTDQTGQAISDFISNLNLQNPATNADNVAYMYNKADLENYKVRAAYATALEVNYKVEKDEDSEVARDIEISSPYVTLFPAHDAASDITVLPDPYVFNTERNAWQVADRTAEIDWNDKETVITMFKDAVVLYQVGNDKYTYAELFGKKYALPLPEKTFDFEITYNPDNNKALMKDGKDEAGYATVKMNEAKSASQLKEACGHTAVGAYSFYTGMGNQTLDATFTVTVTKPTATFKVVTDDIVWTYAQDADADHALFNGETAKYARTKVATTFAADSPNLPGDEKFGLKLSDLSHATPAEWSVYDEDNVEVDGIDIYPIIENEKLYANISGFAWDQTYTVKATYEMADIRVKVEFVFSTVDRKREPVTVTVTPDCTFVINDPETGYDAQTGTYYAQSAPLAASIKAAFEAAGVTKSADFSDADAFAIAELIGKFKAAATPGDNTYLNVAQNVFLETKVNGKALSAKQLLEIAALDRPLQRNVTTYIGQEVRLVWKVGYEVPAYNFKHVEEFVASEGGVFFTQIQPKYWADDNTVDGGRSKLYKYDVEGVDFLKRAWNVVDADDRIVEDLAAAGLTVKFGYSDETLAAKALPNPTCDRTTYADLWNADNTLYYMSNLPAIGIRADLSITSGIGDGAATFPIKTRFDGVGTPEDYSTYEVRRYTPFVYNTPENITVKVVDQKVYEQNLLSGIKIQDVRPGVATRYTVMEDGEWTIGNAATDSSNNGFAANRSAADAYDIQQTLVAEPESLSPAVKDLFTIEGNTLKFNYTGEVKLQKEVAYDVTVTVKTKWQEDITFNYQVIFTPGN